VTDTAGLTAECSFDVVVTDNEAPTISCPADINLNVDAGNCSALATFATPTGDDNCGVASVVQTAGPASGSAFPVGTTTVTFEVTDTAGLTAECSFDVVVTDNEAPVFDCSSLNQLNFDADDNCVNDTNVTPPIATDNCDGQITAVGTRSDNASIDAPFPLGSTTITWTFTDNATPANSFICTQVIVVTDNEAPSITCPSDLTAVCDISEQPAYASYAEFILAGGSASDNCAIDENSFILLSENSDGNTCPETVTRVYQIADESGNLMTCSQIITIDDEIVPSITTQASDINIECGVSDPNALQNWLDSNGGAVATDNCSAVTWVNDYGQDDSLQCDPQTGISVTFTATDACGNSSMTTAMYFIQDTTPPSISVPADVTIECSADESSANTGIATGSDDCSAVSITESDSVVEQCGNTKTITRTWTATDGCGNTTSDTQIITVVDTTPPTISPVAGDQTVECDGQGNVNELNAWLANNAGASATDLCGTVSWTNNFTGLSDDCGETGSAIVIFTATDECGNFITTSAKFEIEDNTPPVLSGQGADANVECPEELVFTAPTVSDICSGNDTPNITFEDAQTTDNCGLSAVTRTWTATDCSGNVSGTVSQTLTYIDTTAPVLSGQGDDANVECPEELVFTAPTASDSCSASNIEPVITFQDTETTDDCGLSAVTRTWTATDCSGNVSETVSQTLTYIDTTAPVLSGQGNDASVECPEELVFTAPTASDSCSASNIEPVITFEDSQVADECGLLAVTRTWTATDCSGNVSETVSQTLTYIDTTAPVLSGQGNDANVECPEELVFTAPTASDYCSASNIDPVITFEDSQVADECGLLAVTRTWTATDCSGNVSETVSQTLTYIDTTAPVLSGQGDDANVECPEELVFTAPTASDSCSASNIEPVITFQDTETTDDCGLSAVTRTWTATDCSGNVSETVSQTLTYIDTTAPLLSGQGDDANVECPEELVFTAPTASDSCSASNIEPVITFEDMQGTNDCGLMSVTRTWTATDCSGNVSATVSQTLTYVDTTAPVLAGQGDDYSIECTGELVFTAPTASDSCSASSSDPMITFVDTETVGDCGLPVVTRTWTATDCSGNTSETVSQTITVIDTTAPVLDTPYDSNISVSCDAIPMAPSLEFSDNCSETVNVSFSENSTADNGNGDYEIIRTWTVDDGCGNQASFTQVISVTRATFIPDNANSLCITEDFDFDLFSTLSGDVDFSGTWTSNSSDAVLNGSLFNPSSLLNEDGSFDQSSLGDYVFTYTVDGDCSSSTDVIININDDCVVLACGREDVVISKTVTPNGDLVNEFFTVEGIELCGFEIDLRIFNRWGAKIYESSNYQNDWSGQAHSNAVGSSNVVPTGTYFYVINLKNSGLQPFTGPIYVVTK
ncbi:HYR-like domain-containing protein, partial [Winogradskyella maritima]